MTDPTGVSKERNREIAANESERQTVSSIRVSVWAIAVAVIIGLVTIGPGIIAADEPQIPPRWPNRPLTAPHDSGHAGQPSDATCCQRFFGFGLGSWSERVRIVC